MLVIPKNCFYCIKNSVRTWRFHYVTIFVMFYASYIDLVFMQAISVFSQLTAIKVVCSIVKVVQLNWFLVNKRLFVYNPKYKKATECDDAKCYRRQRVKISRKIYTAVNCISTSFVKQKIAWSQERFMINVCRFFHSVSCRVIYNCWEVSFALSLYPPESFANPWKKLQKV